jgi:hypothetical protein
MTQNLKVWIVSVALLLGALHQDFWLWDNAELLFGVMPVGLGYHALYSIVVALFWAVVIKVAWPSEPGADPELNDPPPPGEPPQEASP